MSGSLRFSSFVDLETAYSALRDAFGALVVARTRGDDVRERETAYGADRAAVGAALREIPSSWRSDEVEAAIASIRSTLTWMDEIEPVEALEVTGEAGMEPRDVAELRRATMAAFASAGAAIAVGEEVVDRPTALARMASEPDPGVRRVIFDALAEVSRAVDGDGGRESSYRTLLRASAARWARDGSPVEAAAMALGMAPATLEPTLRGMLARFRELLGPNLVEPWDYRHRVGAMERRLLDATPRDRLQAINDAHLGSLGADPAALGIRYDVHPRPGRPAIPVAFCIAEDIARQLPDGSWRSATPWVFATYADGGVGNLEELLHESGHALHYAAIRARPAFFEPLSEAGGLVEGVADLVGWDVHEPAFQARHLGSPSGRRESRVGRYGGVMLDVCWALFEIELHRSPGRNPGEVWAELTETGLGIVPHPESAWWAMRGQLIESPGYMANYALSAIVAAAIRGRVREIRGDWLTDAGDHGWYGFVSEHVLRHGADRSPGDVLAAFLGRPLSADALLEDLAGAMA